LVRPEDFRVAAPDLHADDFGQRGERRRERAAPSLTCLHVARVGEDALQAFARDLPADQPGRVLPLPIGGGARQQCGDRVAHTSAEDEGADQTEERKPREDRVSEPVHPAATGATGMPRSATYIGPSAEACRQVSCLLSDRGWPLASHWRSFVRPDQPFARACIFVSSTAPPAATSDAASA